MGWAVTRRKVTVRRRLRQVMPLLIGIAAAMPAWADAPSPVGRWLTEDKRAVIEVYACGSLFCGKVVWQSEPREKDGTIKVDRYNADPALRRHPLCDLQIMAGFTSVPGSPAEWQDGTIYNPESGSTYSATLRLKDAATLYLRGYIIIPLLGETQTWTLDTTHPSCDGS
jgi:uncharacterized protein (DUF2147 family)